jgi:DNA-directed RNA polymerase sigma subunit (sigma70/sigma32)
MTPNEEAALEELIWELTAPHTQEEIAARLGMRRELVSDIEQRALRKLRKLLKQRGLGFEDLI